MTDLSQRYGSSGTRRTKAAVAVAVVLVAAGLSWLVWVMIANGRPEATSAIVTFRTEGQHAAVAKFTVVRRSAGIEASCLLRAYAEDHSIVGEDHVAVGPGDPTTQTLEHTMRTEREATSVELMGCTTPDQKQAR